MMLTNSLHDDLFMKIAHVEPGHIQTALIEIQQSLMVNSAEDIQSLRAEVDAATMTTNGSDLQTNI